MSRAIADSGFDVEAFARVELPLWTSYALGGGNASKKAASSYTRQNMNWYANFYDGWTKAGGNGAAMRIQPHVWSSADPATLGTADVNVVLDSITTHGHPRAIFGAVFHARTLAFALSRGHVPGPDEWSEVLSEAVQVLDLLAGHHPWDTVWRARWEEQENAPFMQAWTAVAAECAEHLEIASTIDALAVGEDASRRYARLVSALELTDPSRRGAGTLTAVAALALGWWTNRDPMQAALVSAHSFGTDTDTIGTMAAALVGATVTTQPAPGSILDQEYLIWDASRLANIGAGRRVERFRYPDLLSWLAPRAQADCFGNADGKPALAGLAWCTVDSEASYAVGQMRWSWVSTSYGQTLMVKSRANLPELPEALWPAAQTAGQPTREHPSEAADAAAQSNQPVPPKSRTEAGESVEPALFDPVPADVVSSGTDVPARAVQGLESHDLGTADAPTLTPHSDSHSKDAGLSSEPSANNVARMLSWVGRRGYTNEDIGYAVRRLSQVGSLEQAVAFVALLHEHLAGRHKEPSAPTAGD